MNNNIIMFIDADNVSPKHYQFILEEIKKEGRVISQKLYGTIRLWWLLCLVNKIINPVKLPTPGLVIKAIKPNYIQTVIDQITSQIKIN